MTNHSGGFDPRRPPFPTMSTTDTTCECGCRLVEKAAGGLICEQTAARYEATYGHRITTDAPQPRAEVLTPSHP